MPAKRRAIAPMVLAACGIGLLVACQKYQIISRIRNYLFNFNPLCHKQVRVVTNIEDCRRVVSSLRRDLQTLRVLGFDCEWLTVDGERRPVALLQLASKSGLCALFRLCEMQRIPGELQQLLEDETILKVGVAPLDDGKHLLKDYKIHVKGTLDLRHLAVHLDRAPESLAKMTSAFIGVELNKSWRIRCSSWDSQTLTEAQVEYAALDCLVGIEIFREMFKVFAARTGHSFEEFMEVAHGHREMPFRYNGRSGVPGLTGKKNLTLNYTQKRNLATRCKPLYDNCFMEAPDGELLCTMDRTKAEWYRKKGLATIVSAEPLRMRLCFEPSGRAVGQPGAYDLEEKVNQCVVCGDRDNLSRKFVIPKEYRKFFPAIIKSHSSHDILLLCQSCHRDSNMEDNALRERLAILCDAPLICHLKKLKSYAKALRRGNLIDSARTHMLKDIEAFYPGQEITEQLLERLSKLDTKSKAGDNSGHAEKVTNYFKSGPNVGGGLLELEKMWREHFLETMKPRYLPQHWSVVHNANRLGVRAEAGRLDESDRLVVGLVR